MKTIQELKARIQELSKQAVEFSRKASEVCLTDRQQAKFFSKNQPEKALSTADQAYRLTIENGFTNFLQDLESLRSQIREHLKS